jgi:hypothetical protein
LSIPNKEKRLKPLFINALLKALKNIAGNLLDSQTVERKVNSVAPPTIAQISQHVSFAALDPNLD